MSTSNEVFAQERARAQALARARARLHNYGPDFVTPDAVPQEIKERCKNDILFFVNTFVFIDNPSLGEGPEAAQSDVVPFHLWPAQEEVLGKLLTKRLVIVLKARQLGLSWLVCVYALWLTMFRKGRVILIFSKGQTEAMEMIRRIRQMYTRLPEWLQAESPMLMPKLADLEFKNGSRIRSLASTTTGGRSYTSSLVIMDEAAFMHRPDDLYSALKPTIDAGGQLVIVSTFGRLDDFFDRTWEAAKAGTNNFEPIFLGWRARPDRTDEWRERVRAEAASVAHDSREYPETDSDAKQYAGTERYLPGLSFWKACDGKLPAFHGPLILGVDGAHAAGGDTFGLVGVGLYPTKPDLLAVYLIRKWNAPAGGLPLDFNNIEREIITLCRQNRVLHIAYDPKELHQMMGNLTRAGIDTVPFEQGSDREEADKSLLDRIIQGRILFDSSIPHAGDLTKHLDNADKMITRDGRALRIVKRSRVEHIDLAVALSMACHRADELWLPGIGGLSMGRARNSWL